MKQLLKSQIIQIPEGIQVEVSRRCVTVTGPRGTLTRRFTHFNCDIYKTSEGNLKVDCWFATKKKSASVKTICSIINNLITGVTKGFEYHMRLVYAHYPINAIVP
mmetsp:Transcript_35034/g.6307  ORF Transcript_35034/g.6307 Transcript_35034/m.6307 type:complete len:105 (-) Transcript_35034:289-603(-)